MKFVEIAPDFFLNADAIVQFKLANVPERGGWCWVFTLSSGKVLFSVPFATENEARAWLAETFENLVPMKALLKSKHGGYRPE